MLKYLEKTGMSFFVFFFRRKPNFDQDQNVKRRNGDYNGRLIFNFSEKLNIALDSEAEV